MRHNLDPHSRGVLIYRWIVFLLAAGFTLRQIVFAADYSVVGGPFRFLTIWALLLSFFCASRMLALTERRSARDWPALVAVTAVTNALVVFLYWRLWFQDPALVNSGAPLPWWLEYYLHALGPLLQWIDALIVYGAVRTPFRAAGIFVGLVAGYVVWVEWFVAPRAEFPVGSVTTGLPYPFLNNLAFPARLEFYGTTAVSGLVVLAVVWGLAFAIRRYVFSSASRAASPER